MWLFALAVFLSKAGRADALKEPEICYILDAVLFVYGIVLTVLYCHLKLKMRREQQKYSNQAAVYEPLKQTDKQVYSEIPMMGGPSTKGAGKKEDPIYTGLEARKTETYETLQVHEKPN